MALTISTHPTEVITNAPEFVVTTSLVEGASFQDLRVRATIYIGGETEAMAVLDNPKGINDWDLFSVLKSFAGKCDEPVGASNLNIQPGISAELLTAWENYLTGFSTFNASGREIITATSTPGASARTNDLGAMAQGDIFIVANESDYADIGTPDFFWELDTGAKTNLQAQTLYAGLTGGKLRANHIYILMAHITTTSPYIYLTAPSSTINVAGTFSVHKISDFKNNPGVYFHVKFEEVYENASDVTTIGDEEWSDTLLFIPATVRPGESFSDFYITEADKSMLSRGESSMYKFGIGQEIRTMYASPSAYIRGVVVTDDGLTTVTDIPNMGWGMVVVNDNIASIDAEDETVAVRIESVVLGGAAIYSGTYTVIPCEVNCYPDIRALSFVGDLAEESVLFRGLLSETGASAKSFTLDQNRIRKVLNAYKRTVMTLRTVYETEGLRRLLHELIYTKLPVWMFNEDFADNFREVTVISDETAIEDQVQLIESEIEVEYYE